MVKHLSIKKGSIKQLLNEHLLCNSLTSYRSTKSSLEGVLKKIFVKIGITFFLVSLFIIGCQSQLVEQKFEDFGSSGGLSLKRPSNWQAEYHERNGSIVLKAEKGILNKDSVVIVIQPYVFSSNQLNVPEEEVKANINRLKIHFYGDSMTIIQKPARLENEDYEIATAIISIPISSSSEDSAEDDSISYEGDSQVLDNFRTVDLRAVQCANNFAMVYIYKGNNDQLNAEADDIVESIRLTCSANQ